MVSHKSVIYLPLSLHGQIIHLREEMITQWPKVEKAVQCGPLSPTWNSFGPTHILDPSAIDFHGMNILLGRKCLVDRK